jgi:hypothetical protein
VHDLTAVRIWGIVRELAAAGLITLADKAYIGAGEHVLTPYRGRGKPESQKAANRAHARLRAPGERANAQLKSWHILRKLRCCPWQAGRIAKAIHVLKPERSKDEKVQCYRRLAQAPARRLGHVPPGRQNQPSCRLRNVRNQGAVFRRHRIISTILQIGQFVKASLYFQILQDSEKKIRESIDQNLGVCDTSHAYYYRMTP